jgi:predicted outer membrane repeat protein
MTGCLVTVQAPRDISAMRKHLGEIVATTALLSATAGAVHAAGVVGTGTPESCTEAAFDAALVGFGAVTFDCGAAPHTIIFSSTKDIPADADIDGGGLITLSGGNTRAFFTVDASATLTITELTLTRGFGPFGAIENAGTLIVQDSRIDNCTSYGEEGGAIANYGTLTVLATTFAENTSTYHGGAIFSYGGTVDVAESTFVTNSTAGIEEGSGGAIYGFFFANILIEDSTFTGNFSESGGAVVFDGLGAVTNTSFVDNYAPDDFDLFLDRLGGALYISETADVVVSGAHFEGNKTLDGAGGAIYVQADGRLEVDQSTFTENEADFGGAITNDGIAQIRRSTFSGNVASGGGSAILQGLQGEVYSELVIEDSTLTYNEAPERGAILAASGNLLIVRSTVTGNAGYGISVQPTCNTGFSNSIFAYNTPFDCDLDLNQLSGSLGFNIASDDSCVLDSVGDDPSTDPLLAPLEDNGGPTLTRLPDPLSPAIDTGQCDGGGATDQRGVARPQGAACDRGAVERLPVEPPTTTTSSTTTTTTLPGETPCGDPVALTASRDAGFGADAITASDALAVLNAAVGLFACELCVCDVDDSGSIAATDALQTLRTAVGLGGVLDCPVCP